MKNKLYESLMASISKVIKDALNEASIWDMETANGKANSKSKAALDREKNIVSTEASTTSSSSTTADPDGIIYRLDIFHVFS